ncbi:hypothetical protein [Chthonobacter albigriseus]|uniref:hypothetical protein n=1 Tax=Chthonobacter albigriseus TaxID=1683161 RepID=UPI0015EF9C60|nr:hypothetical protein [Chthonobacter albigriseus]
MTTLTAAAGLAAFAALTTPAYGAPGDTCETNRIKGFYRLEALAPWMPAAVRAPAKAA